MAEFLRYAEKMVSSDGSLTYTFPTDNMEYAPTQPMRPVTDQVTGADYAHDYRGSDPWTKELGSEPVRFVIFGATSAALMTEFDSCAATLFRIGRGKLYTIDNAGAERWCWAKLAGRPSYVANVDQFQLMPCEADFVRFSDWFDAAATTGTVAVNATPKTFTITNPGNVPVRFVTFRLRANGAAGFVSPVVTNTDNLYSFQVTRSAVGANDEERVNSETNKVEYSADDGATYADDYSKLVLGATQVGIMRLDPGVNHFSATNTGAPDYSLEYSFYGAYA